MLFTITEGLEDIGIPGMHLTSCMPGCCKPTGSKPVFNLEAGNAEPAHLETLSASTH